MRSARPSAVARSWRICQRIAFGTHRPPAACTFARSSGSHDFTSTSTCRALEGFHGPAATTSSTVVKRVGGESLYR